MNCPDEADVAGPMVMASDGVPVMTTAPGFLVRRAQHMHVGIWLQHVGAALTSMQFGVLLIHAQQPDLDQTGVAEIMSLDKNTAADVLRRLPIAGSGHSRT